MKCNSCGVVNNPDNKYCTNCGDELTNRNNIKGNVCPECGTENELKYKFCTTCGFRILSVQSSSKNNQPRNKTKSKKQKGRVGTKHKSRQVQKIKSKRNRFKEFKALWITIGVIVVSVLIAAASDLIFHKYPDEIPEEEISSNPMIEARVYQIASKFVCSCGACNEEPLETCKCATAVEERQFIRDYLEEDQKPDDIVIAAANKYGWLKAEYAPSYNIDPSKVWNPNQLIVTEDYLNSVPDQINKVATISDKYTIYSAFNCPCGQCDLDELKDCACNHPNGASEVKSFINEKIGENKYTIKEVIDLVDQEYGGRKI